MNWVLFVVIGGIMGVSDIRTVSMSEPQCRASVKMLAPLKNRISAGCVGPNGETFIFKDVKNNDD